MNSIPPHLNTHFLPQTLSHKLSVESASPETDPMDSEHAPQEQQSVSSELQIDFPSGPLSAPSETLFKSSISLNVYNSYGTPTQIVLRGRALYGKNQLSGQDDSWLKNLKEFGKDLIGEDIENLSLNLRFNGQDYTVKTDHKGYFELKLNPNPPLKTGKHNFEVSMPEHKKYDLMSSASAEVMIHDPQQKSTGVVSDIDDTILETHVTSKLKLINSMLFENAHSLDAVPGMSALYNALERADGQEDGDIHYLSGSPINLHDRLDQFKMLNGFPVGSQDLKVMGLGSDQDSIVGQTDYKLEKLRQLFTTYPQRQFILIGDNGQKDPQIYHQIQQEFPAQVKGVLIHNVQQNDKESETYESQLVFNQASEAAEYAQKQGWISLMHVQSVKNAQARETGKN